RPARPSPGATGRARRDRRTKGAGMARARRSHARYLSGRQAQSANRRPGQVPWVCLGSGVRLRPGGALLARLITRGAGLPVGPGGDADGGEPGLGDRAGAGPAEDGPTLPAVPVPAPEKAPALPPPRGGAQPLGPPRRATALT